ncbi:CLUMA_CG000667, isoform A [Clunio marinus]|uniref:CLUMA_CG000667, isoform A n=1 Tax=Clunio marinus TaxID=568069 RepID=A0A1J1HFT9_9DIPT|nr:CLUMA_CG000667, isoform A [Clunio marinus]
MLNLKFNRIFFLILITLSLCALSGASKREKRTIGTILNFFGFKIVPLNEGEKSRGQTEKYQNSEAATKKPKALRLETVMPFLKGMNINANSVENVDKVQDLTTKLPIKIDEISTSMNEKITSTTETPKKMKEETFTVSVLPKIYSDPTAISREAPVAVSRQIVPMRIVVPDDMMMMKKDEKKNLIPTTTESFFKNFELISPNNENKNENYESENQNELPKEGIPCDHSYDEFKIDVRDSDTKISSLPLSNFPDQSYEHNSDDQLKDNDVFEFFRSNDETNKFFGDQSSFTIYPPYFMTERSYEPPHPPPELDSRVSASSTSMYMNGRAYNYVTLH